VFFYFHITHFYFAKVIEFFELQIEKAEKIIFIKLEKHTYILIFNIITNHHILHKTHKKNLSC